jgi:hypothetical protein
MRRIPLEIKGGEKAPVNENACLGAKTPFLQECEKVRQIYIPLVYPFIAELFLEFYTVYVCSNFT